MVSRPQNRAARKRNRSKLGHDLISQIPISRIQPSPENDELYRPVDPDAPDIRDLTKSIRQNGIVEPLVITADGYILSGHRRFAAAIRAGLKKVPCRIKPIRRSDDPDEFVKLLREHNRQREKTFDEKVREAVLDTDPTEAHQSLVTERKRRSIVSTPTLVIVGTKRRSTISSAKRPFLDAILDVLEERRDFWPLSDRSIHYGLLNNPPLIHAAKSISRYGNTKKSYKALVELLTRARLEGHIAMEAIADETRPVTLWDVHQSPTQFIKRSFDRFLKGYWRNYMQSQPNHVEIVGEKNTIKSILQPVAAEFCVPLTLGRGYCSLRPRYDIVQRYRKSGKEKLILLIVSDFDPDGEEIAHSLARSIRDDFGIEQIHPIKAALTSEQVQHFRLPPMMQAKESSMHHDKFVGKYGKNVFELEALPPVELQRILRRTLNSVLDIAALNREIEAEKRDAMHLESVRRAVHDHLRGSEWLSAIEDEE